MVKGIIGGVIGGAIGAAIWAAIAYFTNYEIGIVAWGVGALVGFCTATFAGNSVSPLTGIAAALISLGSIAGGKFAVIHIIASKVRTDIHTKVQFTDERLVAAIADQLAEESEKAGKKVEWPKGMNAEEASEKADYPPAIWKDAETRWNAMTADQRNQYKHDIEEHVHAKVDEAVTSLEKDSFFQSFNLYDAIFALLAVASAFRLGSGELGGGDD